MRIRGCSASFISPHGLVATNHHCIYVPERGGNVMVDVRAIREALDHAYDADRILLESQTGRLYETETAAAAAAR